MKLKKLFGYAILAFALVGCLGNDDDNNSGSDDGNNNGDNSNSTYEVQAEIGPSSTNIQYEYYDNGLLEVWTSTFPGFGTELTFVYNDDFSIQRVDYRDSDEFEYSMSFQYDFEGKLINYNGFSEDVTLDWNDNLVTATGTIEGDANSTALLELDANGRVVKFTESNQYITLSYDSNGNLTNVFQFDLEDNLLNEYSLTYDSSPNPFLGQLSSVYLERFLEFFWEFDGIYFTGLEGYSFPYHSSNVIQIRKNGNSLISYGIAYDNNNYPVVISESSQGESYQFEIIYD